MWTEIQDNMNQHSTATGKLFAAITAFLFVLAEAMPRDMAFAQKLAWYGTFIAGISTGIFYLSKAINYLFKIFLNHKNKKADE